MLSLLFILASAPIVPTQTQTVPYRLVWSDEFNKNWLVDPSKWSYEKGYIRNQEKQFYTEKRLENARVEGGRLIIEARKDNYNGNEVTSASLTTEGKQSWTYGKFEVRAKIPTGRGTWPAIWMLGTDIRKVGWPTCGEIDIMENVGYDPERIHATVHTDAFNHVKNTQRGNSVVLSKPWEKFHTYSCEWSPTEVQFFIDGKKIHEFKKEGTSNDVWPFDKPHYLILNLAIGGAWGGSKGVAEDLLPQKFEIDYVRVYQRRRG